jgi:protein SCO1
MKDVSRREMLGLLGMAPLAGGLVATAQAAEGRVWPTATDGLTPAARARKRIQQQHFPNIPLVNHEGKQVLFYDDLIKGKIVSMNFFYANCQEICPLVLTNLAQVQRLLSKHMGHDFFMYSITLKPEEDTLATLNHHRKMFDAGPGWTFLTGKPEDIEAIRAAIGFKYPDPAIDADKTQHIGNIRYGNEPLMLWSACPGMANPAWIAETLEWMIKPEVSRVQKS